MDALRALAIPGVILGHWPVTTWVAVPLAPIWTGIVAGMALLLVLAPLVGRRSNGGAVL